MKRFKINYQNIVSLNVNRLFEVGGYKVVCISEADTWTQVLTRSPEILLTLLHSPCSGWLFLWFEDVKAAL
jgi:hypothetical protein